MRFFTKYNLPDYIPRHYLDVDNVDRLSYVDNSLMIQRCMTAGKNLKYNNAGLYRYDDVVSGITPGVALSPFTEDLVVSRSKANKLSDSMNQLITDLKNASDLKKLKADNNVNQTPVVVESTNGVSAN